MNISISLTPELLDVIKVRIESGRYASTSEVVREALRLLERMDTRETARTEAMRAAWNEGIKSGDGGILDFNELRAAARQELSRQK